MEDLKKLYPNSFDRLGSLKGAYNIRIDPSVKPATHARRKVPIESKEAIDRELDYLIEEEIITEQVEPTPSVSSVTFPRKPNGDVRVCLDPSNLNKAIIREHHKPMTVEEIAHELPGATVYTKAIALKAFLQIHLTHEASLLTTFNSHRGQLQFLWMPFGAKMSQDVFQLRMDAILEQCPGVIGIQDDMVIFGVDQEDRDANLINLLNVCQKEGLVLNSKKLELRRERVTFFGAEYGAQGMHPDPKKVQGITEMTAPMDKQQLQSFLGMVNYMGTFIPNLSHHTEPLRVILKKDNVFHWEDQQTRSFQQVKTLIAKANTTPLRYYDRNLPVTVQADASLRGLGACLIQKHKGKDQPIAFASKSLTDAETRYANIEQELLAIVFACQRFSTYLLGRSFVAESDHIPRMHSFEDAKLQAGKKATGVRPGRDVDVSDGEQHSLDEPSATTGKEPKTSKQGNSVHSGPNKKITDSVKDSPFSNKTGNNSNAKSGPKMKDTSKKAPRRSITDHPMIPSHFRSTTKVTSNVYKTPNSFTSPMTKANCQAAGKHQSTMNQGQCHARLWRI